ncbi:N-Acyltransferase superfamily protein [Halapricum desulfuricans]|uniref:N-Acyltransferase superfamily protein n=1 Tax=Halapricum desulfuricans TaxID=2841257 RepID=A0A897NM95_9EURY|nr:GNAT family N-acetyltransferase [Halapricum desulfuricans]QSG11336.1 N-Acyltransferase superfamily protein [Halapricum desulfuricans]
MTEYTIRPFQPGDEQPFVDIFNETWSAERTTDWFDWRYHDNPYIEDVPIHVAEHDGDVVATRPYKTYLVRAGDTERLAFLGTDTMTLPDHRRQGLFTRMTEMALEEYADRPEPDRPAFLFGHANQYSMPGYRKMGWEYLSEQVRYNRLQRAGSYVADRIDGLPGRLGRTAATALNRAYLRVTDRRTAFDTDRFTVERHGAVSSETIADVYRACRPDAVHVVYDEAFYEWHFAEPGNRPDASYVVRWDGHPLAGLVVHRDDDERNDTTMVTISHTVPAAGGPERVEAIAAAFERLLADYAHADLVRTSTPLVPEAVLRGFGFRPDDRLPMSKLAERTGLTLGIRPLLDDDWTLNGRPIRSAEPYLWTLA